MGENEYDRHKIVLASPETYFVHSKAVYSSPGALVLNTVTRYMLKGEICDLAPAGDASETAVAIRRMYRYARSGESTESDVLNEACHLTSARANDEHEKLAQKACSLAKQESDGVEWSRKLPGKTYLWTIDFHGGTVNCDMPVIKQAGGVVHAEIGQMCDFYGLCNDRIKILTWDDWKGYDPSEELKAKFRDAYKDDPEFQRVDASICHHPVANCELFVGMGKPIIIHATTRLEFGRHDAGMDWRLGSGYNVEQG